MTYFNPDFGLRISFPTEHWTYREVVHGKQFRFRLLSTHYDLRTIEIHGAPRDPFGAFPSSGAPESVTLNGSEVLYLAEAAGYTDIPVHGRAIYSPQGNLLVVTSEIYAEDTDAVAAEVKALFGEVLATLQFSQPRLSSVQGAQ